MKRLFLLFIVVQTLSAQPSTEQDAPEYQLTDLQNLDPILRQQIIAILMQQAQERRDRLRQSPDEFETTVERRSPDQPRKPSDTEAIFSAATSIISKVALAVITENSASLQEALTIAITGLASRKQDKEQQEKPRVIAQNQAAKKPTQKKPSAQKAQAPAKKPTNQTTKK